MKLDVWCAAVGLSLKITEQYNPRKEERKFIAVIEHNHMEVSEDCGCGVRSLCGWGSTRDEALADLAATASNKPIAYYHGSRRRTRPDVEAPQLEWEAAQEEASV